MSDVLGYARGVLVGDSWRARTLPSFEEEVTRLHEVLASLADAIDASDFSRASPERLLQGPLADAMTHAGQLAMLRRLAGAPIPPENFIEADIAPERLGRDQAEPRSADTVWYEAEEEPW